MQVQVLQVLALLVQALVPPVLLQVQVPRVLLQV